MEIGNLTDLNSKHPQYKNWIVGDFIKERGLRQSKICEVKWDNCPKNTEKESFFDSEGKEKTLAVLVSGEIAISFGDGNKTILSNQGDYVIYKTIPHKIKTLKDTCVIAIRWQEE